MLGNCKFIDLTHDLHSGVPTWSGEAEFETEILKDYPNCGYRLHQYTLRKAGVGTHFDSASHFFQNGRTVLEYELRELIVPACVLNVTKQARLSADYQISIEDIEKWEQANGRIPENSLFIAYTGWEYFWSNREKYLNKDPNGIRHFPGFSKDAAEILLSRKVVGLGIDALSPDPGNSQTFDVHRCFLGGGKYLLENLCNLSKLPPSGAWILTLPLKVRDGSEAPARVVGVISTEH